MADSFQITDQRQTSRLKSNGGFEDVMEIAFIALPANVPGQVMIPLNLYNAENVKTEIDKRVAEINAVANL